jgi:hypothetical protein
MFSQVSAWKRQKEKWTRSVDGEEILVADYVLVSVCISIEKLNPTHNNHSNPRIIPTR